MDNFTVLGCVYILNYFICENILSFCHATKSLRITNWVFGENSSILAGIRDFWEVLCLGFWFLAQAAEVWVLASGEAISKLRVLGVF